MELRVYLHIIARRWWLALIPAILVLDWTDHLSPARQSGRACYGSYTPEFGHMPVRPLLSAWLARVYRRGLGDQTDG
jgi:hypothetical protein